MTPLILPWPTVLASASPRRLELLKRLIPEFEIDVANLDEEALVVADPIETAERLAMAKAKLIAGRHPDKLVIGGDTVVALGSRQLAKPGSFEESVNMLMALAGKEHIVVTAVALVWPGGSKVFPEVARVKFRGIAVEEARAYAATGEPMDKAGGYAIQGGAAEFVESLEGEIETVVGLPKARLREELEVLCLKQNGRA